MRWTAEQLNDYFLKRNSPIGRVPDGRASEVQEYPLGTKIGNSIYCRYEEPDPGKESVLQGKIERWCKDWGRPFLSFRQSKHARHVLPAGWPDLEIIMPAGKTLRIELKSSTGRLSDEQKATRLQFMALGHSIYTINSYRAFLKLTGQFPHKPGEREGVS